MVRLWINKLSAGIFDTINGCPIFLLWIEARKKYHLSHTQIQMARELGLNPKKFGSLSNTKQQPWKLPLPEFIEEIYFKHFKKRAPDSVKSIEQMAKDRARKTAERKTRKEAARLSDETAIT